jgi:hypothetical protein
MRTTLLVCFLAFLGSASSLQAADPFVGTWKLNVAKSKPAPAPPGMAVNAETQVLQATGDQYVLSAKGTRENGAAISSRASFPLKGGPVTYTEGAPPAGISRTMKRINESTLDFSETRDGKVDGTIHAVVSGKTLRLETKGIDEKGKPTTGLVVFDKQ